MRNPISSPPSKTAPKHSKTTPCCAKVGLKRGPWTPEEDEILSAYINKEGEGRWRTLPKRAGLSRCGKSCRLRWMNYLRPSVKRGHIGPDEEDIILRLHRLLSNRWSLIAGRISGRTDNEIKNYWNTHLSKKLISQGIDPRTHKPLNPNDLQSSQIPSSSNPDQSKNAEPIFPITPFSHDPVVSTHFNEDFVGYYHDGENINHCKGLNLQNSNGIRNDDDDDINYCTDDVFSSFLNSLVNEDLFNNNHNQVQQEQIINGSNVVPPVSNSDGLISLPYTGCAFGAGWDAPIMSDSNQNNEPKRFINDQVEKH